ncbi:MAG TPA: hypothetical protein PKH77_21350 [Anaerolineae bacterium]|nr:hypothetical protein [Anaerolineae bacterium]
MPYAELVQAGRLALWQAVLHFEPQRGVQFSTHGGLAVERTLWAVVRQARAAEAKRLPGFPGAAPGETYRLSREVRAAGADGAAPAPPTLTRLFATPAFGNSPHRSWLFGLTSVSYSPVGESQTPALMGRQSAFPAAPP